jgi:hypothetical protein
LDYITEVRYIDRKAAFFQYTKAFGIAICANYMMTDSRQAATGD